MTRLRGGVVLELGPVMTAIVFIGRVGARITAELGTMQVSEQIDAIYSLGRDPVRMLAAPRILAGMLAMPALVGLANGVGSIAGMLAARSTVGLGYERLLVNLQFVNDDGPARVLQPTVLEDDGLPLLRKQLFRGGWDPNEIVALLQ